jgi:hypothetical protein
MLTRSTTPLLVAYIFLLAAGIMFLETPPLSLQDSSAYNALITIWALFYVGGSGVAFLSVIGRTFLKVKNLTALWQFEIAGLSLIVVANLFYSYALLRTGLYYQEYNVVAFALVISAFAASFVGRVIDTLRLIRVVNNVSSTRKGAK